MAQSEKSGVRTAVFSDLHVPYTCPKAWDWIIEQLKEFRPKRIVVNGDALDCPGISRFADGNSTTSLREDALAKWELFEEARTVSQAEQCDEIEGNHEQRLKRPDLIQKYAMETLRDEWDPRIHPEAENWNQTPYLFQRKGVLSLNKQVFCWHGFAASHSSDQSEALAMMDEFKPVRYYGQLCLRGHSHRPKLITQCMKTQSQPLPIFYGNTGCVVNRSELKYTEQIRTAQWGTGIALLTIWKSGWRGEIRIRS